MFERYHDKSRRVIFFARYEASQWGDPFITPSHMLLGIAREDKALTARLGITADDLPRLLGLRKTGETIPSAQDLPLDQEAKDVLRLAAEEADLLGDEVILPVHLLLGLLRQPCGASAVLEKQGIDLAKARPGGTPTNKILNDLRHQFGRLALQLKPDMEPAVSYKLEKRK